MVINTSNSTAVLFSKRTKPMVQRLRIGRTYVPWSKEVKYLGLHFDRRLIWRIRARRCTERLPPALVSCFRYSHTRQRFAGKASWSFVLSVMTYAIPVWSYLTAMRKQKLQSVLERGLKLGVKVPLSNREKRALFSFSLRNHGAPCMYVLSTSDQELRQLSHWRV